MFPVRKELVGKRFAYIHGNGRSGTRHRGSMPGPEQNWDALSWVTGTILSSNVDGLEAQSEFVFVKRVKVFVEYDGKYQLPKEWIKLYSGSHRVFLIEENLVLCRRNDGGMYGQQSYCLPALRMVPILDRNFLDENPHLIPVEYMGARKQLTFVVFEDIIQLYPNEDQTLLLQSIQKDKYLKADYQRWERIQKTQMILLFGPYSLTGCRVEIIDTSNGRCFRAVIISHDYMKRVVDVMDDQLLKSRKVNPKLIHINFLASDEEIDRLMYGEAPKAIPTRYSRYGHQMQSARGQIDGPGTGEAPGHQVHQFTLPQWMTNNVLVNQDQYENLQATSRQDYPPEGGLVCSPPNTALPFRDERQLESTNVGVMNTQDRGRQMVDLQDGLPQKQDQIAASLYNDAQMQNIHPIMATKSASTATSAIMSPVHQPSHFAPICASPLHKSLYPKDKQHFRSPTSSVGSPANLMDLQTQERPGTAPCIDSSGKKAFSPTPNLSSPKGQVADMYSSFQRRSSNFEGSPFNYDGQLQLGNCHSQGIRDGSADKWPPGSQQSTVSQMERSFADFHRRLSLPEGHSLKERPELHGLQSAANSPHLIDAFAEQRAKLERRIPFEQALDRTAEKPLPQGPLGSFTDSDLSHFLNQLDGYINAPLRASAQAPGGHSHPREHFQAVRSMLNTALTESPRDEMLSHFQQKLANYYSHFQKLDMADPRQLQENYEHQTSKQVFERLYGALPGQRRSRPGSPLSNLSRSMSMDSFHPAPGPFSMSPPTGVLKKPRAKRPPRKPKKEKSKDDTAQPSLEATKKVSSLMSGQHDKPSGASQAADHTSVDSSENKNLESEKKKPISSDTSDSSKAAASETDVKDASPKLSIKKDSCIAQDSVELTKNTTDREKTPTALNKEDGQVDACNQDVSAQVAVAAARATEERCSANEEVVQNTGGQKLPSEALWFENPKDGKKMASAKQAPGADERDGEAGGKTNAAASGSDVIEQPPSPEFLPVKDKESEFSLETISGEGPLIGDSSHQKPLLKELQPGIATPESFSDGEGSREVMVNEKMRDKKEVNQSQASASADSSMKPDFPSTTSESGEGTLADANHIVEAEEKGESAISKVPTTSLPLSTLGINKGNISGASPREDSKIVRNMYGRTLYRDQKGPSFPLQLRTDKIIQDSPLSVKKIPDLQHQQSQNGSEVEGNLKEKETREGASDECEPYPPDKVSQTPPSTLPETHTGVERLDEAKPREIAQKEEKGASKPVEKQIKEKGVPRKRKCRHKRKPCKCETMEQESRDPHSGLISPGQQGAILPFAPFPFFSQMHEGPSAITQASFKLGGMENATARETPQFDASFAVNYKQQGLANTLEGRTLEGRTLEGRTLEGRTLEERTLEGRTLERRTLEGRTLVGHPSSAVSFHEPPFSVLESKEVSESSFVATPTTVSAVQFSSLFPPANLVNKASNGAKLVTPSFSNEQGFAGSAERTPENALNFAANVNQAQGTTKTTEKKPGQRTGKKARCRHKRKPCKCEIEAAAMVDAHVNMLRFLDQANEAGSGGSNVVDIPQSLFEDRADEASSMPTSIPLLQTLTTVESNTPSRPLISPGQLQSIQKLEPPGESNWNASQSDISLPSFAEISKMAVKALNPEKNTFDEADFVHSVIPKTSLKGHNTNPVSSPSGQGPAVMVNPASKADLAMIPDCSSENQSVAPVIASTLPVNADPDNSAQVKPEKKRRSSTGRKCRHKRKPCRCDAEAAMASIANSGTDKYGEISIAHLKNVASGLLSSLAKQRMASATSQGTPSTGAHKERDPAPHAAFNNASDRMLHEVKHDSGLREDIAKGNDKVESNEAGEKTKKLVEDGSSLSGSANPDTAASRNKVERESTLEYLGSKDHGQVASDGGGTSDIATPVRAGGSMGMAECKGVSLSAGRPTVDRLIQTQEGEDWKKERGSESNRSHVASVPANSGARKQCVDCNEIAATKQGKSHLVKPIMDRKQDQEQGQDMVQTCKAVLASLLEKVTMFDEKFKAARSKPSKPKSSKKGAKELPITAPEVPDADAIEPKTDIVTSKKTAKAGEVKTKVKNSKTGTVPAVGKGVSQAEDTGIATGSAFTISVPTTISLPTNLLSTVGSRLTARAKIVCPEKNLLPLKGTPVNVSFDGGKTFTLANIIEIRNKKKPASEGGKDEDSGAKSATGKAENSALQQLLEKEESKAGKSTNVIDAVVLGVSKAESKPEEAGSSEELSAACEKVKGEAVASLSEESSDEIGDEDGVEGTLPKVERRTRGGRSRELRRSNRFRHAEASPGKARTEDCLSQLSESEFSGDLSDDPNYKPAHTLPDSASKVEKRKMTPRKGTVDKQNDESDAKSIDAPAGSPKKQENPKRTTETSKDEMFDCCDIHKDLFCRKCLLFREVEGLWPAASRSKEVNSAWRKFVKNCDEHGLSKCTTCSSLPEEEEAALCTDDRAAKQGDQKVSQDGAETQSCQGKVVDAKEGNDASKEDTCLKGQSQIGSGERGKKLTAEGKEERNGKDETDKYSANRRLRVKKDSSHGLKDRSAGEGSDLAEAKGTSCSGEDAIGMKGEEDSSNAKADQGKIKTEEKKRLAKVNETAAEVHVSARENPEKSKKRKLQSVPDECKSPVEKKAKAEAKFALPLEQCLIHGRFRCGTCKSFYETDGRWPGWARRGEVQYRWENEDATRVERKTVKCRIHLRVKCPKCLPFKNKKGIWPSYLQKDEVENTYYNMLQGKSQAREKHVDEARDSKKEDQKMKRSTDASGRVNKKKEEIRRRKFNADYGSEARGERRQTKKNGDKESDGDEAKISKRGRKRDKIGTKEDKTCSIHETYFCALCYELKRSLGYWPKDIKAVKRNARKRAKERALIAEKWKKCVIHQNSLCIKCFNFWEQEKRVPGSADEKMVTDLHVKLEEEIGEKKCMVHEDLMCPLCVPVYIIEKNLPSQEDHLKSIYSWKLFEGMSSQEKDDKKMRLVKAPGTDRKKADRPEKVVKYSMKIAKKFYCEIHKVFPCFICVSKFIENGSWPSGDQKEIFEQWPTEKIESIKCLEHSKMFCRRCSRMNDLFEKHALPGVTDRFRTMVMENIKLRREIIEKRIGSNVVKGRIPFQREEKEPVKEKKRKRLADDDGDEDDDDDSKRLSVSFSGRVRSMVSRPGTVDISKLADDFIVRGSKGTTNTEKAKAMPKSGEDHEAEVPIKRKRGRPPKKRVEGEDPVPKKKQKKSALIDKLRDGSIKIVNVEDLYEQLRSERPRDPSPAHLEYIQFLENAEKMNVKYFAIHADDKVAVKAGSLEKGGDKVKIDADNRVDKENTEKGASPAVAASTQQEASDKEPNQDASGKEESTADEASGVATKIDGFDSWSEKDVALIIERVEKAAEAAKQQKEAASQKRKHKQSKKPLTVAQVLAIKRSKGADAMPIMDECMQKDLEKMLVEAGRRKVDLDTVLEEALKARDKGVGMKKRGRKPILHKMETFLQERPCSQTPKLPKCRDCRIADKRDADQHAFCRFVMFRRLSRKLKTGKLESAGFCSPQAATGDAFGPWVSHAKDVDMKVAVCYYIIKNIAGQFCTVVEEECNALLLGTKDGAVGWKRAVAGVREMCDACATTIFNIHWVCEKCGFGVCLDCYRSKIWEQEVKDEGSKAFEFHWISCAPGLSHKPRTMTVTQMIPENALWELCQSTIDICTALEVPFKLSENVLKMVMPLRAPQRTPTSPRNVASVSPKKPTHAEPLADGASISEKVIVPLVYPTLVSDSNTQPDDSNQTEVAGSRMETGTPTQTPGGEESKVTSSFTSQTLSSPGNGAPNSTITVINEASPIPIDSGKSQERPTVSQDGLAVDEEMESPTVVDVSTVPCDSMIKMVKDEICEEPVKEPAQENENGLIEMQDCVPGCAGSVKGKPLDNDKSVAMTASAVDADCDVRVAEDGNQPPRPAGLEASGNSAPRIKEEVNAGIENEPVESRDEKSYEYYHSVCETALSVVRSIQTWKEASEKMAEPGEFSGNDDCYYEKPKHPEPTCDSAFRHPVTAFDNCLHRDTNSEGVEEPPVAREEKATSSEGYFANNLDILAMVASGFLDQGKTKQDNVAVEQGHDIVKDAAAQPQSLHPETFVNNIAQDCPVASYLCDGALLQLNYSRHPDNIRLFRNVWKKGFPLIVSRVNELLDKNLWNPESFANEFGSEMVDVVNCRNGQILHQFSVGDFWKGFESVKDRPVDSQDLPMLLKLKDWPPGDDFRDKMPRRFEDLMNAIPLPDYTRRDGQWNLVSRLPTNHFIKPDLGPKMYNAYGSAAVPSAGTTNLHLDMSDAVNVMVYVGVPRDPILGEQEVEDALKTVEIACCDKTIERVRQKEVLPGALWHIYAAEDADKIRKFLRKVAEERRLKYSVHNDPIHDQSFYLDHELRKRLKAEFDVTGFAICQCLGDAVFIPAGAPHQVLNLHSCVKVAEDFVSPERIGQCFNLTQEFRYLSDRHTNHEDKLQVKNIIYHAVKDSVAVLKENLRRQRAEES